MKQSFSHIQYNAFPVNHLAEPKKEKITMTQYSTYKKILHIHLTVRLAKNEVPLVYGVLHIRNLVAVPSYQVIIPPRSLKIQTPIIKGTCSVSNV